MLRVKGLVICFYLGWSGSILQFRQNIIKVGSKSWLLTCSSNITLSLPSYTGSALKRELNFCNGYLSLLYFCLESLKSTISVAKMYLIKSPIFPPDKSSSLCSAIDGFNFESINGTTYRRRKYWNENWWFYEVHISTLMVVFTDSSGYYISNSTITNFTNKSENSY